MCPPNSTESAPCLNYATSALPSETSRIPSVEASLDSNDHQAVTNENDHLYLTSTHLRQRHLRPTRTMSTCRLSRRTGNLSPLYKWFSQLTTMSHSSLVLTLLLIIISLTSQVSCLGIFELRLDEFVNELNRDASGRCCGYNTTTDHEICEEKCQTFFRVCFKNYQANIDTNSTCLYGEKLTPVLFGGDRFSNHTIRFPFEFSWPGTFSLIIEAWNNASASAPAKHHKQSPITRSLIARTFESRPVRLRVGNKWTQKASRINHAVLHYSYRVLCDQHYYGESCTKSCKPRNDNLGHFECGPNGERICQPGWSGEYCVKAVCRSCNETNGECVRPDQCRCRSGWLGDNCNQCSKYPGCKHGYCNKPWECICKEGWGGLLCNLDLNYCTNHRPCKNGGVCTNTGEGSFTCQCPPGFTGKHCEIEVDSCEHAPCLNGATCKSRPPLNYTCECPTGFHGRHCEHITSACSSNPCENEGTCVDGPSGYLCVCKLGYSGSKCEVRQKDCNPNPCLNGANCVSNSSLSNEEGYTCQCRAGFSGDHCEVNINDCESNPCLNSGTCIDEVNSFRCLCVPGFVGELCQVNVDDCLMKPCANGGSCIDRNNDYMCVCPPGYTGKDCSVNVDDCASNPCLNGGYCQDRVNEFECLCPPNFSGLRCETVDKAALLENSTLSFSAAIKKDEEEDSAFSSAQLVLIIFGSISLPLIAIIVSIVFILCKHWKKHDIKMKSRRDEDEARRQNEHNAVMSSMNNKCLDQCLNPSAANVIVNSLDRPQSLHHLNKCHNYSNKMTNEYVYGRHLDKSATLQKGFKSVNSITAANNHKSLNTDLSVKLSLEDPYSHTYEQIQKPSNLAGQHINYQLSPKQTNVDIYEKRDVYSTLVGGKASTIKSDCPPVITTSQCVESLYGSNVDGNSKAHGNLQNNIQIAATLQRMGCRSNSIYVIEDHYSQPIYGDPKKLQATEV